MYKPKHKMQIKQNTKSPRIKTLYTSISFKVQVIIQISNKNNSKLFSVLFFRNILLMRLGISVVGVLCIQNYDTGIEHKLYVQCYLCSCPYYLIVVSLSTVRAQKIHFHVYTSILFQQSTIDVA